MTCFFEAVDLVDLFVLPVTMLSSPTGCKAAHVTLFDKPWKVSRLYTATPDTIATTTSNGTWADGQYLEHCTKLV